MEISTNYVATSACRSLAGGDLKSWRSLLGIELQVMVLSVVCSYGTLTLVRIQWWRRSELGWPAEAPATSEAAAGATSSSGARPQRTGGLAKGLTELLKMLGARCRAHFRASVAAVTAATSPAPWNSWPRRGYGLEVESD